MTKAPNTIWAWTDKEFDCTLWNSHGDTRYTPDFAVEYVSRSHCEALVAAGMNAMKESIQKGCLDSEHGHALLKMINLTPADAKAAYDAAIAKARADALREAAALCDTARAKRRDQMAETDDVIQQERFRVGTLQAKLNSEAILALIPETSHD